MSEEKVEKKQPDKPSLKTFRTQHNLNVREKPIQGSPIVITLQPGDEIKSDGRVYKGGYLRCVTAIGYEGYVNKDYVVEV